MYPTITKTELETLFTTKYLERLLLLDVREPSEFSSAELPAIHSHAKNIPLGSLEHTFEEDSNQFMANVGQEKPFLNDRIILYCRSGRRACTAADILSKMEYSNVAIYKGSAMEWHTIP